jgi:DNA-binding transcriptional LysR family regulator
MSKWERITAFIDVVEENGFAAAAKKQGISTAAISRKISQLEADLKVTLLSRTTRQLSLTESGKLYYQGCKKSVGTLDDIETDLMASQQEVMGMLRLTSNRYFATRYLIPHLPVFMAQHPKLKVSLELAERFPDFVQEDIDLVFGVSMEGPLDLVRKRVAVTRYVLCASPGYLKQYGTPETPADLIKHRYLTHSMRSPNNRLIFKGNKELYLEPILWLNDSQALLECALLGMGIIALHEYVVDDALQSGQLVELLRAYQEPRVPVFLYYRQQRYLQPKIRQFIDFYDQTIQVS